MHIRLTPNWANNLSSVARIKKQFPTIEFTGPGWYYSRDESLLIVPAYDTAGDPFASNVDGPFVLYCFAAGAERFFSVIAYAPTRQDTRVRDEAAAVGE